MPSCCSANGIECQRWRLSLGRLPPLVPLWVLERIPGRGLNLLPGGHRAAQRRGRGAFEYSQGAPISASDPIIVPVQALVDAVQFHFVRIPPIRTRQPVGCCRSVPYPPLEAAA